MSAYDAARSGAALRQASNPLARVVGRARATQGSLIIVLKPGKMHADEVDTDVPLVRRLLAAQFPQWAGLPIEPVLSSGTQNAVYRLGPDMSVRLPRIDPGARGVAAEQRWTVELAPLLPVAIPVALGRGEPAEGYPWQWSVCRWVAGENPVAGRLADPDGLAEDLAGFIGALGRIDAADGPGAYRGGPLSGVDRATRAAVAELRGQVDTVAVSAAWDRALAAEPWTGRPVWVHSDLMPGNLVVDRGRLTGVIDFGTVGVGDPACDMIVAWYLLPAGAREVLRARSGVDRATWDRGRGWALSMAVIQLPYYQHTNPVLADGARLVIREVLAEAGPGAGAGPGLLRP